MPGYGMMQGTRLQQAQSQSRQRQEILRHLNRVRQKRRLVRELLKAESWTVQKALRQAQLSLK
jgi:hypothetical protein